MSATLNAQELGALLKTFKNKILEKAAKLTVANSQKLGGKTLAEVTAMGGGGLDSTELVGALNEVAAEILAAGAKWSGTITVGSSGNSVGYASALLSGGTDVGAISNSAFEITNIIHSVSYDPTTTPDTLTLMIEGTLPNDNYITSISVNGTVLTTQTGAVVVMPFNSHNIYQYNFNGDAVAALFTNARGNVLNVEIN